MAERVRVREITNEEGSRLLRIVRRSSGSVVTWRRAQMVLLSAQGMAVAKIAEVTFTSRGPGPGRDPQLQRRRLRLALPEVRGRPAADVHAARSAGRSRRSPSPGRPSTTCRSRPGAWPSWPTSWSPRGWSTTSATRACGSCSARRASRFNAMKTWKTVQRPRLRGQEEPGPEHLYAIADGDVIPEDGDPTVVICMDEFGPLNLQPHPGRQWAERGGGTRTPTANRGAGGGRPTPARTGSGTCSPPTTWPRDRLYGHIKPTQEPHRVPGVLPLPAHRCTRPTCASRSCCDNFSPHLIDQDDASGSATWAAANNVELAYTPTNASWLNRIEAQFTALRYFALDGTDHASHKRAGQHDPPLHHLAEPQRPRPRTTRSRRTGQTLPDAALGGRPGPDHQLGPVGPFTAVKGDGLAAWRPHDEAELLGLAEQWGDVHVAPGTGSERT